MPRILLFLGFFLSSVSLWAQGRPPESQGPEFQGSSESLLNRLPEKVDTFQASSFYLGNPFLIEEKTDSTLEHDFFQPDPAFKGPFAHANLGNLGSAMSPLVYENDLRDGFWEGFSLFDNYKLHPETLPFYRMKSSFSEAEFHQGRTQEDHFLNVRFAQKFGKSLSFSMHHIRIKHAGVFPNQAVSHIGLNTGLWYHHPNGRYQAFLFYTSNRHQQEENGGYDPSGATVENLEQEETFPVFLDGPASHLQKRIAGITQF
ncbi:MAG: hypothetical protein HKN16_02225, partial [Saprospiraceae bacterium]|nr:hypothetical protein [Saprospiraceae bacterium]